MSDPNAQSASDPTSGPHGSQGGKAGGQHGGPATMAPGTGATSVNFSSLYEQKRSQDPESVARRQSINEQKEASSGTLGKIFRNIVKGE